MTQLLASLILFLLAFVGLGAGLLLRGRRLRSGCGHTPNQAHECHCETDLDKGFQGQSRCRELGKKF